MSILQRVRRLLAVVMVAAATTLLLTPTGVAQDDEVRTETSLFGYNLKAHATPVSVRIFESFIPIPTDPGDPQAELTASFTEARLGTGPAGRAVASTLWPGPALGDGFGTVVGDESQSYPIRAAAQYPGSGPDDWDQSQSLDGSDGFTMSASARGLDVTARADGAGLPDAATDLVDVGDVRSRSNVTVRDGQAVSTAVASVAEVSLLDAVIVLEDVRTQLSAVSDGDTATTSGATTVGAITVLGQRVELTDSGVQVITDDDDGDDDEGGSDDLIPTDILDPVNQILQQLTDDLVADGVEETLGIHIQVLDHAETLDGPIAARGADGVRVTVDLEVLRDYLDPLVALLPINDVLDGLPSDLNEVRGIVLELLALGPTLEMVVGRGAVAASASPPFESTLPPPPPPPAPPAVDTGTSVPPSPLAVPPPTTSLPPHTPQAQPVPPSPQIAEPQAQAPVVAPIELPEPFEGIPAALTAFALFFAAIPTYGLTTLRERAVGAGAAVDVPRALPDLRGGA